MGPAAGPQAGTSGHDVSRPLTSGSRTTAAGYRLVRRCENNGWYAPRDAAVAVGPRERWDIVRKYYLALPFRIARNASRRMRRRLREWFAARRS